MVWLLHTQKLGLPKHGIFYHLRDRHRQIMQSVHQYKASTILCVYHCLPTVCLPSLSQAQSFLRYSKYLKAWWRLNAPSDPSSERRGSHGTGCFWSSRQLYWSLSPAPNRSPGQYFMPPSGHLQLKINEDSMQKNGSHRWSEIHRDKDSDRKKKLTNLLNISKR